jgi:hypothetical protein
MKFNWRPEQRERGLAGVAAALQPKGLDLCQGAKGTKRLAFVRPHQNTSWYFYTSPKLTEIKIHNSLWTNKPYVTLAEAQRACEEYVTKALEAAKIQQEESSMDTNKGVN